MNSEPDSTFCLTTDDVQSMAEAMPVAFERVTGEVDRTIRMREAEKAEDIWGPMINGIEKQIGTGQNILSLFESGDSDDSLIIDFASAKAAGIDPWAHLRPRNDGSIADPFPEVSEKCSLEDTAALFADSDDDHYSWLDEEWDDR